MISLVATVTCLGGWAVLPMARSVPEVALMLLITGVGAGVSGVAMNVQGHLVEVRRRKVLMPFWHGLFLLVPCLALLRVGMDVFGYSFGNRVKVLGLIPKPKPTSIGIVAPKGKLNPAAEKFWQCAKEAASKKKESSSAARRRKDNN
jgi:hypothetical protein